MKDIIGVVLILGAAAWSCGGGSGLGFDEPDEEDLADVWQENINDGDVDTELEFQSDGTYEIRRDTDPATVVQGTYTLTPAAEVGAGLPLLRFTPTGGQPRSEYIQFYDATTLSITQSPENEYDPAFPTYSR